MTHKYYFGLENLSTGRSQFEMRSLFPMQMIQESILWYMWYVVKISYCWGLGVVAVPNLSTLGALEVVLMTTSGADGSPELFIHRVLWINYEAP